MASEYDDGCAKGASISYDDGMISYPTQSEAENAGRGYTDTSPDGQVQKSGRELGMDVIGATDENSSTFRGTDVQTVK